ncbi:MAG: VCBS repeat-containing protein [Planctomycetes bacterium]|nr:VCBS repeat-containing protein [Planctomycetota bacterium]
MVGFDDILVVIGAWGAVLGRNRTSARRGYSREVIEVLAPSLLALALGSGPCDHPVFGNPQLSEVHHPQGLVLGDLDGDGDPDLAVANAIFGTWSHDVSVFLNRGDGIFDLTGFYDADITGGVAKIGARDIDGDDDLDLVVLDGSGGEIAVLFNHGDATFMPYVAYATGDGPLSVAFGDLDGDDDQDLVVGNRNDSTISVFFNDGNGTLSTSGALPVFGICCIDDVAMADFDDDGDLDVLAAGQGLAVLPNEGAGTLGAPALLAVPCCVHSLEAVDLDGDGDVDLATSGSSGRLVHLNSGGGVFAAGVSYGDGNAFDEVTAVDVDGDADLDLVYGNQGLDEPLTVLLNAGDGTFSPGGTHPAWQGTEQIVAGDVNGDGGSDLAVAGAGVVTLLVNNGFGFTPRRREILSVPDSVVSGDLDGDGDADLLMSSPWALAMLRNRGDARFSTSYLPSGGGTSLGLALGDLDGDQDLDAVNTHFTADEVSVWLNDGNGGLSPAGSYATGPAPRRVEIGDLDGALGADVIVVNSGGADVSVLLNTGGGVLAPAVTYPVGTAPAALDLDDFDGDGDLDVVVANEADDTVSVLINAGDGTFPPATTYAVGDGPRAVVAADLDEGGGVDLAVVNKLDGSVSVLFNDGGGVFTAPATFELPESATPETLRAGDVDADGDHDLVVASETESLFVYDQALVLLNHDSGRVFGPPIGYGVGRRPSDLALDDLDGDGDLDLAVPGKLSDDLALLFNRCTIEPPCPGDFNNSGDVGFADVLVVLSEWGPCFFECFADLNGNGIVGFDDILVLIGMWGPC